MRLNVAARPLHNSAYGNTIDADGEAWIKLTPIPETVASIGVREWWPNKASSKR